MFGREALGGERRARGRDRGASGGWWAVGLVGPLALCVAGCTPKATPSPTSEPASAAGATAAARPSAVAAVASEAAGPPHEQPPPAALVPEIERASKIGNLLYHHDRWSATATDLALAQSPLGKDRTIKGWVVEERGGGAVVHFVRAGVTSAIRVTFPGAEPRGATLEVRDQPLPAPMVTGARAIETARDACLSSKLPRLARTYNPVVLPGSLWGEPGLLVYLLAADERPGEIAIGGHVRVHVSADGATATTIAPLSKTIVRIPMSPPSSAGDDPAATPFVTHLLTDVPAETHVWTSLAVRRGLFVGTRAGMWRVDGAKIAFFGAPPAKAAP
jgi:hypothetical protein